MTKAPIDVEGGLSAHVVGRDAKVCSSGPSWSACIPQQRQNLAKGDVVRFDGKLARGVGEHGTILNYVFSTAGAPGGKTP